MTVFFVCTIYTVYPNNFQVDVPYKNKKGEQEIAYIDVSVVVNIKDPDIQAKLDKVEAIVRAHAKPV